jgi:hypothetical protein
VSGGGELLRAWAFAAVMSRATARSRRRMGISIRSAEFARL